MVQTAVIGGLTKQEELSLRVGLPILKDIPITWLSISYNKKSIQNQDLVIFVTPRLSMNN
jgi:type II secretory pathway component HofQ